MDLTMAMVLVSYILGLFTGFGFMLWMKDMEIVRKVKP